MEVFVWIGTGFAFALAFWFLMFLFNSFEAWTQRITPEQARRRVRMWLEQQPPPGSPGD